jgi:two-component system phosphate regulon response regulator PhoB
VVEDDESLRLLCRLTLEFEQLAVRAAATLDEARGAVAAERPDVVLLDVHLEGQSADGLLDELRGAGIPVVLVTGDADLDRYRDRADGVLAKPFEPAELVAAARQHLVR